MAVPTVSTIVFPFISFFLLEIIPHYLSVSAYVVQTCRDSGLISINCGLAAGMSYYYQPSGRNYTCDNKYINSGKNFKVSSTFYNTSDPHGLGATVRSFPEGRRNCYELWPVKPNHKYFIRLRFMYGNYDGKNSVPQFDVYIGVNFWFTVSLSDAGDRTSEEMIHAATAESIDVCLLNTGRGTPFISVLELEPLERSSSYSVSPYFSLHRWDQADVGGFASTPGDYEVKDDAYDRLWYESPSWMPDWKVITSNESFDASQANPYKVPASVLNVAGELTATAFTYHAPLIGSKAQVYAYWYFAELELLGSNDTREFTIFTAGYKFGPISPKHLKLTTIVSPLVSINGSGDFEFILMKTDKSNLYPILNAFELYKVLELPNLSTNQEDADAIAAIRDEYAVPRIWQGDPCFGVNYQWDALNCTYGQNDPPRITSLDLSSSNLTGEIPPSLSNLASLKYLNLSNNGFTGKIPEFLAYLPSIKAIDLSGNALTGLVPPMLVEMALNKSIDLRLEGNLDVCKSYLCWEEKEKTVVNKKRHLFIIPLVACVSTVSLLVIISIIFLAFKQRKEQGLVSINSKNKQFNASDIVRITDGFRKVLGKGGYGTVYYGVLQDGTEVAVKVLSNTSPTINVKQFCVETELLMRIHHANLVSLIGYCNDQTNMALVYEYMSSGNLQMHLSEKNERPLSLKARLGISIDAAQGLEYLHSNCRPSVVHRDVKPANILLDEMGRAKIADFGLCRYCPIDREGSAVTDIVGTRGYLDPEYCRRFAFSEKSDVYAFGIVLLQLLTGQPALIKNISNKKEVLIHIVEWVSKVVESGDILAIVDKRLPGDFQVSSAMKFFEIAMECVKQTGDQRPRMSKVVKDLKLFYESEGFHDQMALASADNWNYNLQSSQQFDSTLTVIIPR